MHHFPIGLAAGATAAAKAKRLRPCVIGSVDCLNARIVPGTRDLRSYGPPDLLEDFAALRVVCGAKGCAQHRADQQTAHTFRYFSLTASSTCPPDRCLIKWMIPTASKPSVIVVASIAQI